MINKISDKIVFSGLNLIKNGKLNITTFQNKKLQFGNDDNLEVSIKINKPDFSKNIIAKIVLNKGINDKKIPALLAPIIETAPAQQ